MEGPDGHKAFRDFSVALRTRGNPTTVDGPGAALSANRTAQKPVTGTPNPTINCIPKMAGREERGVFAAVITQGVYNQFLAGPSVRQDSSRTTGTAALGRGKCAGVRVNLARHNQEEFEKRGGRQGHGSNMKSSTGASRRRGDYAARLQWALRNICVLVCWLCPGMNFSNRATSNGTAGTMVVYLLPSAGTSSGAVTPSDSIARTHRLGTPTSRQTRPKENAQWNKSVHKRDTERLACCLGDPEGIAMPYAQMTKKMHSSKRNEGGQSALGRRRQRWAEELSAAAARAPVARVVREEACGISNKLSIKCWISSF
ncbi:hypothetical protein BJV74DRAFT_794390 [Russula compacta]|nr:hypothetical protein BJV74DRAFT_794390 [Russula compacta]